MAGARVHLRRPLGGHRRGGRARVPERPGRAGPAGWGCRPRCSGRRRRPAVPRCVSEPLGDAPPSASLDRATVVELGSLWAGPLCGSLLQVAGATVVKVESTPVPTGRGAARAASSTSSTRGSDRWPRPVQSPTGGEALGAGHRSGRRRDRGLAAACARAARRRAVDVVVAGGPRVWVSITGHGAADPAPTGSRSATMPRSPAASSRATSRGRCSAPTPSRIRSRGWWRRARPCRRSRQGAAGSSTSSLSAVAAAAAGPTLAVTQPVEVAPPRAAGEGAGPSPRRAQRAPPGADRYRGIGKMTGSSAIARTAASRSSAEGAR